MAYIICKDLVLGYDGRVVTEGINFSVGEGDYLCIVGENGAGKSTLMKTILKLNPMFYIVSGYRNALINKHWFWETPRQMLYFWVVTLLILGVGMLVFKRLKPHFADVL